MFKNCGLKDPSKYIKNTMYILVMKGKCESSGIKIFITSSCKTKKLNTFYHHLGSLFTSNCDFTC